VTVAQKFLDSAAQVSQEVRRSADGLTSIDYVEDVAVTHYGEGFNGQTLGCGTGNYSSDNGGIVAVGPERNQEWPCGTVLRICGPGGCMIGERVDSCPGCDGYHVDLSEEGLYLVCGPGTGVCRASVEVFTQTRVEAFIPACEFTSISLISEIKGAVDGVGGISMKLFATLAETALADRTARLLNLAPDRPPSTGACLVRAPP
jgi:hypothetical protein